MQKTTRQFVIHSLISHTTYYLIKNMKTTKHISVMLGIIILFLGTLLWQNREDQKKNTELIAELVSHLKDEKQEKTKEIWKEEVGDDKNIPEVLAEEYVVQNDQELISDCFGNYWSNDYYKNWPKSMKFNKNAPWASVYLFVEDNYTYTQKKSGNNWNSSKDRRSKVPAEKFIDLNGDGLLDYIYYDHQVIHYGYPINSDGYSNYMKIRDCVLLNNGQGFNIAYRCITDAEWESSGSRTADVYYYGDCADTSHF